MLRHQKAATCRSLVGIWQAGRELYFLGARMEGLILLNCWIPLSQPLFHHTQCQHQPAPTIPEEGSQVAPKNRFPASGTQSTAACRKSEGKKLKHHEMAAIVGNHNLTDCPSGHPLGPRWYQIGSQPKWVISQSPSIILSRWNQNINISCT